MYDCLAIRSEGGLHIDLNRHGRIHIHSILGDGKPNWEPAEWADYLADPQRFVAYLEERSRLPHVESLPDTTPRTLTYRVLGAFARMHAFGTPIQIDWNVIDASNSWGSILGGWTSKYPTIERMSKEKPHGFWTVASKYFEVTIEAETCRVHSKDGSITSLHDKYRTLDRSFDRLFGYVLGDLQQ